MERELWRRISQTITVVDRRYPKGRYAHSVGRVVRVYLWAVLNDRPTSWACLRENWRGVRPPNSLPDQSRMSRRIPRQDTQSFLAAVMDQLTRSDRIELVKFIDGKPIAISRYSQDPDAGFGRGAGGMSNGYKLHAIYGQSGRLLAWQVHPMNVDERKVAVKLVGELTDQGYLLGDGNYDSHPLYAAADARGHQFLARRRHGPGRGIGWRPQAPSRLRGIALLEGPSQFGRALYSQRRRIETSFGNLCSFGGGLTCLPPWVRRLSRVRTYVAAKLLIRAARTAIINEPAA
jgi:IS5 family transposase